MIFPEISLQDWVRRHPQLRVIEVQCLQCDGTIKTEKPFIAKDYLGLLALNCPSCGIEHRTYTGLPYSKSEIEAWNSL
jgi:hypothetical protein